MDIVEKAKAFAHRAHEGHMRNDREGNNYIVHPAEVVELVKNSGGNDAEIAAAWLHDTIEDTPITLEDIKHEFGDEIAEIVYGLTDLPEFEELSMQERKAKQAERVCNESNSVKRVKLADQSSNVRGMGARIFLKATDEWSLDYIEAAHKIAEACKGVSPYLDKIFEERYQEAKRNLTS